MSNPTTSTMTKADFSRATGLSGLQTRRRGGYQALLAQINEHAWYLAQRRHAPVELPEAAAHWFETIYAPVVAELERAGIVECHPTKTPADLYLAVCEQKWCLSERAGRDVGFGPGIAAVAGSDPAASKPARSRKTPIQAA